MATKIFQTSVLAALVERCHRFYEFKFLAFCNGNDDPIHRHRAQRRLVGTIFKLPEHWTCHNNICLPIPHVETIRHHDREGRPLPKPSQRDDLVRAESYLWAN